MEGDAGDRKGGGSNSDQILTNEEIKEGGRQQDRGASRPKGDNEDGPAAQCSWIEATELVLRESGEPHMHIKDILAGILAKNLQRSSKKDSLDAQLYRESLKPGSRIVRIEGQKGLFALRSRSPGAEGSPNGTSASSVAAKPASSSGGPGSRSRKRPAAAVAQEASVESIGPDCLEAALTASSNAGAGAGGMSMDLAQVYTGFGNTYGLSQGGPVSKQELSLNDTDAVAIRNEYKTLKRIFKKLIVENQALRHVVQREKLDFQVLHRKKRLLLGDLAAKQQTDLGPLRECISDADWANLLPETFPQAPGSRHLEEEEEEEHIEEDAEDATGGEEPVGGVSTHM